MRPDPEQSVDLGWVAGLVAAHGAAELEIAEEPEAPVAEAL